MCKWLAPANRMQNYTLFANAPTFSIDFSKLFWESAGLNRLIVNNYGIIGILE